MNRMRITNEVTPLASDARSLKAMSEVLTKGIYHLQNEKCGVLNAPVRRTQIICNTRCQCTWHHAYVHGCTVMITI